MSVLLNRRLNFYSVILFSSLFNITAVYGHGQKECSTHKTTSLNVEPIPYSYADAGEGPHWDVATQNLYYVDMNAGKLSRYDFKENKVYKVQIEGENFASFVIPVEGSTDQFAVGCGHRVAIVQWNGVDKIANVSKTLFEVELDDPRFEGNRFNDGKCDPRGQLFAGTMRYVGDEMQYRYGALYKYKKDCNFELIKSDVGISNGLAWDEQAKKMFYIDSADFEVKSYDYDFETGMPSNPKVVFNFRGNGSRDNLVPDGMTIDTDGNIYVATFNGHTVYKINPTTGKVLLEIKLPCKQITSAAFGGPNLDILFVTSSAQMNQPEPAGTTFKVTGLGAKGYPMTNININMCK